MALTVNITSGWDAEVCNSDPNGTRGGRGVFGVGEIASGDAIFRSYIKFNYGSFPSTTVVTGATLHIYHNYEDSHNYRQYDIHRVTGDWSEGTITWNNKPGYASPFEAWLITYDSETNGWRNINMCNDGYTGKDTIQGHLRGTVANYGWVILSPVANDDFHEYRSFQWSDSNYRPYLTITYYYAPSVSTGTASGISTSKATLNGNITSVNGANCSVRGFQYGLSQTPTWSVSQNGDYGTGSYSLVANNLFSGRLYYFRSYATNPAGTTYGSWISFQMPILGSSMI